MSLSPTKSRRDQEYLSSTVERWSSPSKSPVRSPLQREPRPMSLSPTKSRREQEYLSSTVERLSSPTNSPVCPLYRRNQDLGCINQGLLCPQRIRQYPLRKMKVYAIRHPFDQVNVCRLFEHLKVTLEYKNHSLVPEYAKSWHYPCRGNPFLQSDPLIVGRGLQPDRINVNGTPSSREMWLLHQGRHLIDAIERQLRDRQEGQNCPVELLDQKTRLRK